MELTGNLLTVDRRLYELSHGENPVITQEYYTSLRALLEDAQAAKDADCLALRAVRAAKDADCLALRAVRAALDEADVPDRMAGSSVPWSLAERVRRALSGASLGLRLRPDGLTEGRIAGPGVNAAPTTPPPPSPPPPSAGRVPGTRITIQTGSPFEIEITERED